MTDKPVGTSEFRHGWRLVLAASFGFSFFSVNLAAAGLFMAPLAKEFGWSRTLLSGGPSIATTMTAVLGPFFGALIDRYGSRRLALPGLVATIGAVCAFGLLNGRPWEWLGMWVVFGVVSVSIKSTIWTSAVVGLFERSRGLALGLTLSGTAIAQALVPPLANWLIEQWGWRTAFVGLGLGWGGITLFLAWLFLHVPGETTRTSNLDEPRLRTANLKSGLTVKEAWRNRALWQLALSSFLIMALTMGLTIHLFPILTEAGVTRKHAALLTGLSGLAGIAGKLVTGYLLDRIRPNIVGGLTLCAAAAGFALLIEGIASPTLIVIALLVNGYAAGTKTHITGYLTAGYAGMRSFGAIYGFMSALVSLASGLGPLLAGVSYDVLGGYAPFLAFGTIGCLAGGLLIITMPAVPNHGHGTE
ncbi:MFS transporter [Novosphingobium sp.]|uniref:MFS transporter n=1 Tax=Novosphingobium sp. TaxID=1874826 RepID=UPI002611CB6E|nr:MFS transporter [Novosphingobium sp.]